MKAARGGTRRPLRWGLVAAQVALCTLLLAGAGLLISTFRHLRAVDPGFDQEHLVTFSLDPTMLRYDGRQAKSLQSRLIAAARQLPGVRSAAIASRGLILGTGLKASVALQGQRIEASDFLNSSTNAVSPEYFDTLGMRILEGRGFRAGESAVKPARVVVNRAFVRRFFPRADPIGRRFGIGRVGAIVKRDDEIIGVVSDAKYRSIREVIPPTVYSYWSKNFSQSFFLEVRTANRPESVIEPMRKALYAIDPRPPFYEIHTMAEEVDASLWPDRVLAWLSTIFSFLAVALAALGMYGAVAYRIAESRREIGIRVALRAGSGHILRQFTARPVFLTALGLAAGLAIFFAAAPVFGDVLYGVSPADQLPLAVAAVATLGTTLAAAGIGAASALRIDPAALLRQE